MKYEVGVGLADARVVLKSSLARLARQFSLADARVRKVKSGFAPLALQADGRDGIQQFCWRKACKGKICFARFASQTLLASNFCLARQKSPKSR